MDAMTYIKELTPYLKAVIDSTSDLPAILLGIVGAHLTILISVAVAIFSEEKDYEVLDRNVILDHVIKAKHIVFYLLLSTIPLTFWTCSLNPTRFLELLLWFAGLICIIRILVRSYHWMKGNKFNLRFNYLRSLDDNKDIEEAWRSVWQGEKINHENEQEFFNIFKIAVNKLLANNNLVTASKLINDFDNFISNRSSIFISRIDGSLVTILEWHFDSWEKESEYVNSDAVLNTWATYNNLSRALVSIFEKIEIRAISERLSAYSFFKILGDHIMKHINEPTATNNYCETVLDDFYRVFFSHISDSADKHNIWRHNFPLKWKVNIANLTSDEHILPYTTLNNYLSYSSDRIANPIEGMDYNLDEITRNIFPEVDPILWAKILIFLFSPYGENRAKSVIERPWNFGVFGRTHVYSTDSVSIREKVFKTEEAATLELATILFKEDLSTANLDMYLEELESLKYDDESEYGKKRKRLLSLFKSMKSYVDRV